MYRKDKKDEYYTRKAHKEGYPARSVYKLQEIDLKYHLFKKGDRVLDLGCSPGSWLLYISSKIGPTGLIKGIDIEELKIKTPDNAVFLKKSILELDKDEVIVLGKFDTVVSDSAPSTTGVKSLDAGKSLELSEKAFEVALEALNPKGAFLCKIFESQEANQFIKNIESQFNLTKKIRPRATTRNSSEFYFLGQGFKI